MFGLPAIGRGNHPNPFRTRKLNHAPFAVVVLSSATRSRGSWWPASSLNKKVKWFNGSTPRRWSSSPRTSRVFFRLVCLSTNWSLEIRSSPELSIEAGELCIYIGDPCLQHIRVAGLCGRSFLTWRHVGGDYAVLDPKDRLAALATRGSWVTIIMVLPSSLLTLAR